MKYKITAKQQIEHLWTTVLFAALPLIIVTKGQFEDEPPRGMDLLNVTLILFTIVALPTIYGFALHYNFMKYRGSYIWLDIYKRVRVIKADGTNIIIPNAEVETIKVLCNPLYNFTYPKLPWDSYFYISIKTTDDHTYTTTSLVSPKGLDGFSSHPKSVVQKRYFPWIRRDMPNQAARTTPVSAPR